LSSAVVVVGCRTVEPLLLSVRAMSSLLAMLVLVLASLLAAMVARAIAGGAFAVVLFLTLLVGGAMVLVINARSGEP